MVDRVKAFIAAHPDHLQRSQPAGHLTGSAWLADPTGRQVLLTHHRKLGIWVQLGGHADGDPDLLAVALREAHEESGIRVIDAVSPAIFDLDIHPIPARGSEPAHHHYDVRFALRAGERRFVVGDESHDLAWVTIDRLAEKTTEPSLLRMAAKWRRLAGGG